jgi:hypothetical protein
MLPARTILLAAGMLLGAAAAHGQLEIKSGAVNLLDHRRAGASAEVQSGAVSLIVVRGGGGGYLTAPLVVIAPPTGGTTATATAQILNGSVVAVTVTNAGSGYTTPPAVFIAPPVTPVGPASTTPQFAGMASTSTTAGPLSEDGITSGRYPRSQDTTVPAAPVVTAVLVRASFGYSFASGVPLYLLGEEIQRPQIRWDGVPVAQNYWRPRPVAPGETFDGVMLENLDVSAQPVVLRPLVTVTQSSLDSQQVTVASLPAGLIPGATLLGQRVNLISGLTLTLGGNADAAIASATPVPFSPYQPFYYSPHANRVFASQAGRVTITWVSALPDTSKPGENTPTYKFRTETFAVSSASQQPARTIYWTEKGFNGPLVPIPEGRIVRVNPIYNSFIPPMTQEYQPVGSLPNPSPGVAFPPEPRTIWFDNQNGPAALHAYNVEGRIMIEYLGLEQQGGSGLHLFLGADIVDIKRVADVTTIETHLGEKLLPRQEDPEPGDSQLIPLIQFTFSQGQKLAYGSRIRPDGVTDYFAERESLNADQVSVYWMEANDAAIHFLTPPSGPGLSIAWPKFKRNYRLTWPANLESYETVNVLQTGAGPAIGPRFAAASLPQIVFQDDPAGLEAEIDAATQRLVVDFSASADQINRSLLKFNSSAGPWYVRLFIQSEDAFGSPETILPNGTVVPAVYTINDRDGDGLPDLVFPATVGTRLEPPPGGYAVAGYVSQGHCFAASLYLDPFVAGVEEAAAGGIIPVNALETDRNLTVWWFRKVVPPSNKFEPFYLPAVAARYTVSYPENPQELVIASGKGVENPGLTPDQAAGSIYYQNNPQQRGYNPNEEHALMLAGNAYALRDDLNTPTSSQPFVLIQYTQPATGTAPARPAMRVLRVVRETQTYPLSYLAIAGTPSQPPMPLRILPLPLLEDGQTVRNYEVPSVNDLPADSDAPDHYKSFTFVDRKGLHWTYRGPHDDGEPTFGLRFFYYLLEGFHFPGLNVQPPVGSIHPFIADIGGGEAVTLTYRPVWPDDESLPVQMRKPVPVMQTGQTLTLQTAGLPQVRGQSSAQLHYQQSIANSGAEAVALHDPTRAKIALLEAGPGKLDQLPASILTTKYAGKTYFQRLPPHLQQRFYFQGTLGERGGLVLVGEFVHEVGAEDYLHLNLLSAEDEALLKGLCPATDTANKEKWNLAIESLSTTLQTFEEKMPGTYLPKPQEISDKAGHDERSDVLDPDTAVDSYALSSTGLGTGYVTLVFGNGRAFTNPGDPVQMQIIRVVEEIYKGDLKVLLASNPLDEQVVLRHSGDYGGEPANFVFEWRYGFSQGGMPPSLANVLASPDWIDPRPGGVLGSKILVGGRPDAVLSTPAVLMGDTWFTMRYRKVGTDLWSDWMTPALVEGWVKRVLARITPFNQRMDNLYTVALNTDVSLLTQAGKRWEGDIALNLNNVNEAGLIEIYETILNRAKSFTIGSGIDFGSSNDALILAAGYLHDLYSILGHEAYADAANPTISIDDQDTVTEVNTSRFSFEGQVASSLDEEMGLLRGRDDFGLPSVSIAPAYNRLWWNYTRGIDSGEVLYAVNYNIREKAGSPTANGILDAADAQRMFPQGHGDAYGHYLTALKGYYKLLTHPYFTWIPRAEAVNVLGQAVLVDYKDERKFASAAANVARTSRETLALVHRQSYREDPYGGWEHFRDGKLNPRTGIVRHQGLDETASRSAQGAFYHWVVANALLPDVDRNPEHTGVQVIDRTTVPELHQLAASAEAFQSTMDLANARLNPLGLSSGAIAFDISPAEHQAGNSHYEQVYARALRALLNAKGSFDQAAKMTRLLRNQENQIARQQEAIEDQEGTFVRQLIEIYGTPYAGDVGPGKTYAQGYSGPDTHRWFIINRPLDDLLKPLLTTDKVTVTMRVPTNIRSFTGSRINDIQSSYNSVDTVEKTFDIIPNQFLQFADVIGPGATLGRRAQTGALQDALMETHLAQVALLEAHQELRVLQERFLREGQIFQGLVQGHANALFYHRVYSSIITAATFTASLLQNLAVSLQWAAEAARDAGDSFQESLPKVLGVANDPTAPARGGIKFVALQVSSGLMTGAIAAYGGSGILDGTIAGYEYDLQRELMKIGFNQDQLQAAYEFELLYRELLQQHYRFTQLLVSLQQANERVSNLSAQGQSLLMERESFRQRAAAVITGYRTKDLTFRTFRNEALEQYRTLFDLASRYTYLAAKSYDYETGLLGSAQGRSVIHRIVSARALGDLTGGAPQATTSTLGDAGLAGNLAQMNADFAVAKGRLGINNPDPYGTLFSLRRELFRILDEADLPDSDAAWQQALEQMIVPDLMGDADVARYCNNLRPPTGGPVPGLVIPFSTTIEHGRNFFGLPLAAGDHAYSPSSYATKISSAGIVLKGYVGMDPYAPGSVVATSPHGLSATPYIYLIPCGDDYMLAPPLAGNYTVRRWTVHDQALPLPYNLGAGAFNTTQFFTANGTLSEQPWVLRKHQAFRPVHDPAFFYSSVPAEFTNRRLIARSVWNSQWKIVIPAYTLFNDEQEGINRFVASVKDIQLFLRTYSHSGN